MYHFGGSNSHQIINSNNIHYGNDNRTPSSGTHQELQSPYMYSNHQIHQRNIPETQKENLQNAALESHQFMATTSATNRGNGNSSTALLRQWRRRSTTNQMKQQLSPTQQIQQSSPPLQHHNTNQIIQQSTVASHQINNNVQQQSQQYPVSTPSHITGHTGPTPQQMRQHYPTTNDILETHHHSHATKYYPSLPTNTTSPTTPTQPNLDQIMDVNYYNRNEPSAYYGAKNQNQPKPKYPQNYPTYSPQMGYNKPTAVMNPPPPPSVQTITQQISYQNHVAKGSLYRNYDQTNAELMRNRSFGNETTSSFPYDPYSRGQQKLVSNDYYHQMGYKLPPPNNVYKKSSYIPSPYHPAPSEDYYKYQVNPEHTDMSANNYNNPSLGTAYDPNWLQCCSEMKSTPRYPCYPEPMIRKCNMNTYTPSGPPTASYQQRLRYDEYNNFNYNSNVVKPQPVTPNKYPTWDQNKNYCTTIADKYPFHGYGTNSLPSSGTNYYNTENYLQPEKQVRYHQNILDPYNNYSNKQHFMYPNWRMNTQATSGSEIIDFENHIKVNRTQKYEYANKSKLNLKEFLETWDEDEEAEENQNNHTIINLPDVVLSNKASKEDENMLYILESTNIPEETVWSDYKHIQQIDKLPDNIKLVEEIKTPNELTSDKLQHEFDAIIPDSTRCDTVIKSPDTTADCIQTTIEDTLSILENDGDIVSSTCSVIKSPTGIASSEKPEKSVIEIKILDNSIVENVTTTYNNKATIIDFETKDITVKCNGHCSFINKCEQCQTDDIINELISPRISEICTQSNLSHYSSSKCGDEDEDDIEEDQDENSFNSISENEILDLRRADDEKRFNFENLITKLHTDNSPKSLTAICTEKYISEQFNVTTIAIKHDDTVELKMVDNEVSELNENGVLDLSERRNSQLSESIITDVKEFPHIKRHLSADDRIFDEHEVKSPKSSKIETQTTNASTQNDSKTDNHLKSQIVELNDQIKFVPLDSSTESSESKIQNSSSELNPKLVQNDWDRIKMKSESEQSVISETNTNILKNDAQSENIQKNNSECFSKFSTNDNSNNLENECLKQKESEILKSTKNLISNHADDQIIKNTKNFDEDVNMEIFVQNLNQNISETNNTHQNIDGNQSIDENKVEKDLNDEVSETINYCEDNSLSVNSETSSNCLSDNDNNYINNDKVTEDNVISRDVDSISVQQSDNFPSTSSPKFEENRHVNKINLSPLNHQIVSNVCKKQELNPINDGLSKSSSEIESEDNINEMDVNDNTVPKRSSLEEQQVEKINNAQDSESFARDENKGGDIEDPPSVSEYEDSADSKSIDTISENTSNETSSDIDSYVQSPIHVENSEVAKINTPMNIERNEKTVIKTPLSSPGSISETVKSQSESMASVISNCDENSETVFSNAMQESDIENTKHQNFSETAISNTIEESDIGNTKHQNFFVNETNSEPGEEIENEKQQVINEENVFEKQQVDDISLSRQRVDEIANEKQNLDDTTDGNIFTEKQSGDEIDIKKRHFRENTTETQPQTENDIEKQPSTNITTEAQDNDKIGIEKQSIGDISTETQSGDEVNIEKEHLDEIITETVSECEIDIKTQSIKDITPETQTDGKIIIEKRCFDDTEEMQSDGKIDIAKQCVDDNTVETESDNEINIEKQHTDDITVEIQSDNEINIEKQHTDDITVETQSSDNIDIEKQRDDDISIETESDNEIDIQRQFVDDITVEFQSNNEIDIEKQHADDITVETQSSDNIDIEKQRDDDITVEIQSNNEIDIKKKCVNGIAVEPQSDNEVHIEKRNIDDIAGEKQFDNKIDIENEHIDDIAIGTQPDNEKDKNFDDMADMTLDSDIDNQIQHAENMAVGTHHKNDGKEFVDDYTILARNDIDIEEQHVDCISEKIQHAKEVIEKEHSDNIFAEKQQGENEIETQNISVETKHFDKMDWDEHVDNIAVHQDDENATGKEHVADNIINQELQEHNEEEKSCVHKVAQSSEHTDEISNENPQIGSITVDTQPENDTNIFVKMQQDDGLEKRHVNNIFDEKPTADDINSEKQFVDNIFCESQDNNVDSEEIVETELDMDTRHDNDIDEQKQNVDEISVSEEIYIEKQHITLHGDEIITEEPHVESEGILIANENSEITTENISNQSSKTIDSTDYIEEHSEIVNSVNIDGSVPMDPWIQLTEDIIAQTKTSIFNTFHVDHKTSENYSTHEQINEKNLNIETLSSLCRRKLDEKQVVKDNSKPSSPLPADNCPEIYDQVCYEEVIDENMQSDDENENILIENSEENYQDAEADTEVIDDISDENIVLIIESNDDESDETGFLDDSSTIIIAFDDELLESNNIENDETGQVSFPINSENESNSNEINTDSIIEKEIQLEIENILTKATDENETELEENEPQIQNEVSQNEELSESISNSPRVDEDFENENPNLWLYTEEEVVSKFDEEIKNDETTDSSISNEESESSEIIPSPKLNETDKKDYSIKKFDESFKSNKKIESSEISSSSNYTEEEESCKKSDEEIEVKKSDEKEKPEEMIANENDTKNEEEVQPTEEIRSNKKRRKSDEEEIKFDKENIVMSKEVKKSDEEIDHNKKRRKSDDEKRKHSGIDTISNDKYTEVIKSTEQIDNNIKRRKSDDGEQKSIQKSADKESKIKCTEEIKSAENKKRRKSDDGKMKSSELEINKESNVKCTLAMKSTEDIGSESKKRRKSNEEESSEKMFGEKSGNIQRTSSDQGSSSNETDKSLKTKENIGDLKNKYNKNYKKNKFKYENFRGSCSEYERKRSKHEGKTSKYLPHSYKSSYHSKDSSKVIEKNNNSENFNANEMRDDAKTASSNVCNILNNYDKYFEQQRMVANYKIPKLSSSTSSKQEYPKNSLVVSNNNKTKSSDNKNSHGIKIKIKNITDQVYKSGYRNKGAGSSINQYKIINKHSINQSLISSNKLINDNNKVVPKVIIKRETSTNCKQNITNQTDKHHMFTTNLILNNAFKWQPFVRIVRDTKIDRMALKLYKQQKIILKINRVNNNNYHYCSSESSQTSSPSASASYKSASFKCRIKLDKNMLPAIVQSTEFNQD